MVLDLDTKSYKIKSLLRQVMRVLASNLIWTLACRPA